MSAQQSVFVYVGFSGILSLIIEIVVLPSYLFCKRFIAPHNMCGGFAHMVLVLSTHGLVC